MKTLINTNTNPYYNLALEEYLLKNQDMKEDLFYLWRNEDSVILGRNQNPYNEINLEYAKDKDIKIVRRSSGGGTVYHDMGNINFTFISTKVRERVHNYEFFLQFMIDILHTLGIEARFSPKTHIYVGEDKISGNAQTYFKEKMCHHGTLLFDVNKKHLEGILDSQTKRDTIAIPSDRSKTKNIKEMGLDHLSTLDFISYIMDKMSPFLDGEIVLPSQAENDILSLMNTKYKSWDWIYGQTPTFTVQKQDFECIVQHGHIKDASHYKEELEGLLYDKAYLTKHFDHHIDRDKILHLLFQ